MFCSKCGNELKAGSNFCNKCGNPINVTDNSISKEDSKESIKIKNLKTEKNIFLVLFLFGIGVFIYCIYINLHEVAPLTVVLVLLCSLFFAHLFDKAKKEIEKLEK